MYLVHSTLYDVHSSTRATVYLYDVLYILVYKYGVCTRSATMYYYVVLQSTYSHESVSEDTGQRSESDRHQYYKARCVSHLHMIVQKHTTSQCYVPGRPPGGVMRPG